MDDLSRASYAASVANSLQKCFAPWSRVPPEEWAEEVYRLPDGRRFRWDYAPYSRAMFRAIFDPLNIETAFEMYSRGLKSTVVLLAIGYIIDQAPRRILSLWPTNSQGEKWSKDNLCGELLDTTPALHFLGNQSGRRIASNTLLHKLFPGGLIDIFGANAPGDMRRAKGSFLYADEIDAIATEQTDEGDQIAIFNKRGDEYADTIRVFASYPSVLGASRIHSKLEESDGNQWHSTCVKCGGEPFVMHRRHLQYEKEKPETARLICPRCEAALDDRQRMEMAHGQGFENWRPTRPFRGRRGFQANAMLWPHPVDAQKFPGGFLQMLAQQEIDAARSDNPKRSMRVLVNTVDAEPFDPTEESERAPDWQRLFGLREDYADAHRITVPQPVALVTCFVDIQNNRLELEWKGWGRDEQSWGLDYVVLDGNPLDIQPGSVWHRLMAELQRTFTRADGAELKLSVCFCDAGKWGDWAFLAYRLSLTFPALAGKFMLSKGIGMHGAPINPRKMAGIHRNIKGFPIGAWAGKDLVYARLRLEPNGDGTFPSGYMHHPKRYDANYFQQLTSDHVVLEYKGSEEVRRYGNNEGKRDEALDCAYGNLAVFMLRRWNWDVIERELAEQVVAKNEGKPVPVKPAGATVLRGRGFSL